jgi:aminotransferase
MSRHPGRFSDKVEQIPPSGIRQFFDLVIGAKDIISLGVGEPDFVTPWPICEEAIYSIEHGRTSYTSNRGLTELREKIAGYMTTRFHVAYDAVTEVIVTVGVSEAADIVLRALLNPGDEVILPEPNYICYSPLISLTGATAVPINTAQTGLLPDPLAIENAITPHTRAIILVSPNNPTGMVIPKDRLLAISDIANRHNLWVISDEIYAELTFDADYYSFAALPGMRDRTILMSGFSKAHAMTGWRIGYVCAHADVIERALKIHQYAIMCAPIMSQYAAIKALDETERSVDEMRRSYKARRNFFVGRLNEIGLETALPQGAFYCFADIRSLGMSSQDFAFALLESEKVAVIPGHVFGLGGEGYIRCCYATGMPELKEAAARIERFVLSRR